MKKGFIIFYLIFSVFSGFFVFSFISIHKSYASLDAGFVNSNIWYSQDNFTEGDKIKIYTVIFNPDSRQFSGTVSFFDKTVLLGKKNFSISGNGVNNVSIDWTVIAGDHTIFAKIENSKFLISDGKY